MCIKWFYKKRGDQSSHGNHIFVIVCAALFLVQSRTFHKKVIVPLSLQSQTFEICTQTKTDDTHLLQLAVLLKISKEILKIDPKRVSHPRSIGIISVSNIVYLIKLHWASPPPFITKVKIRHRHHKTLQAHLGSRDITIAAAAAASQAVSAFV